MSKKVGLLFSLFVVVLLIVAACGGEEQSSNDKSGTTNQGSEPAEEQVEINFWSSNFPYASEMVELFEEKYPNIKVNNQQFDAEDMKVQLRLTVSAGDIPDVYVTETGETFNEYAERNAALDITEYVGDWNDLLDPDFLAANTIDGEVYGVPWSALHPWQVIYYNKDFFEEHNIATPTTIDELIEVSETVTQLGMHPLAWGIRDGWPMSLLLGDFFVQQAGSEHIDGLNSGAISWTDSEVVRNSFETMQKLAESNTFVPGYNTMTQNDGIMSWATGSAAMLYNGTWWTGVTETADLDFEIGVMALPQIFPGTEIQATQYWAGNTMVIGSHVEGAVKDASITFMEFMIGDEAMATMGNVAGAFTSNANVNEQLDLADFYQSEHFISQMDLPKVNYFDHVFPLAVTDEMKNQMSRLVNGATTVEAALEEIEKVHQNNR